jgi:hypothetical protein
MPLIMDNTDPGDTTMNDVVDMQASGMMDPMEDLFGEAANDLSVHVPLPVTLPPPPGLVQRIAEMQTFGCCT